VRGLRVLLAMVWLHMLRSYRFTFSLVNWGVIDFLWLSIYILAVLAFTEPVSYPTVVPLLFWAVIAWSFMSSPVWMIGNWMRFYVNEGIMESHEVSNVSHTLFLSLRFIPSLLMALASAIAASIILVVVTGVNPLRVENPILLGLALATLLAQATMYALILAYTSLYIGTPAPALDILTFMMFVAGGVGVPVSSLPEPLRALALILPYSHPSEVMRYAVVGLEPHLGLRTELALSLAYAVLLYALLKVIELKALRKAKIVGVKGIGWT